MQSVTELLYEIHAAPMLSALLRDVTPRLDDDPGHDLSHSLRVALWTIRLGGADVPQDRAIASALLHDIVNIPKDSPDRSLASVRSAGLAQELLRRHGFSEEAVRDVCDAVRDHSYSRGVTPTSSLGKALQDADRLEGLGALGVFRTVSTGVRMNARYFDPEDPWAESRPLDDKRQTVDHFFVKLLKLPATMNTAAGKREATKRAEFMQLFLQQLGDELGRPAPQER